MRSRSSKTILSQAINTRRRISTRTFAVCNQPPFFILFYSLLLANDRYFSSLSTVARFTGTTKELGVLLLLCRGINSSVLLRSSSSFVPLIIFNQARMMLIDFDNILLQKMTGALRPLFLIGKSAFFYFFGATNS